MQNYIKNYVKIFVTIYSFFFFFFYPCKGKKEKNTWVWELQHTVFQTSCEYFTNSGLSDDFAHPYSKTKL